MLWIPAFAGMTFLLNCLNPILAADAPAKPLPYALLNRALTEQVALPAVAALVPAMQNLAQASAEFCLDPPTGSHTRTIDAFHASMAAWQHAQPLVFGPLAKDNRQARFEFWPDSGGSTDRQIRRVLTERDPALVAEGGLAGKSVAIQNLATFERLLADNVARLAGAGASATAEDKYACAWMSAIARFQAGLAQQVADEWTGGFAAAVIGAESGNAVYADARAATSEYLKSLAGILDIVIRLKLERSMDATVAKARAARAESWRTKRSMDNIVANLETARALMATPGGFADLLAAAGSGPLARGMVGQLSAALALARSVGSLEDALGDAAMRPKLEELVRLLKSLRTLIQGPLSTETGLVLGFNALDGD